MDDLCSDYRHDRDNYPGNCVVGRLRRPTSVVVTYHCADNSPRIGTESDVCGMRWYTAGWAGVNLARVTAALLVTAPLWSLGHSAVKAVNS